MKKLLFVLFLAFASLQAESLTLTFYQLGGYETGFERTVGAEKAKELIQKAKKDTNFKKAYDLLNKKITAGIKDKEDFPDTIKILELLKKSKPVYAKFVGLELYVLSRNEYPQEKYIKKYAIPLSKALMESNYCIGYNFYGSFLGRLGAPKSKEYEIFKKGAQNNCIGSKAEKFYLKVKKNDAKN